MECGSISLSFYPFSLSPTLPLPPSCPSPPPRAADLSTTPSLSLSLWLPLSICVSLYHFLRVGPLIFRAFLIALGTRPRTPGPSLLLAGRKRGLQPAGGRRDVPRSRQSATPNDVASHGRHRHDRVGTTFKKKKNNAYFFSCFKVFTPQTDHQFSLCDLL